MLQSFKKYGVQLCFLLLTLSGYAQHIPSERVIAIDDIFPYLKTSVQKDLGEVSQAGLALHFRTVFASRYFYDWHETDTRFEEYKRLYPKMETYHTARAQDHLDKFDDSTFWKLPFNYKNGTPINAYGLRHLARQHKMVDIAFLYRYENKNPSYIDYYTSQLASLNNALITNSFETINDGNGVYESFRSGYRILNWLQIHNGYLGEAAYTDKNQLTTIATLLQHAAHLYKNNKEFKAGNHQTRGLSALAMLAIILNDFKDADVWYTHAMSLLEEHLKREINEDGFQFERTIHYHQSDIDNYFYVYQLAQKSNMLVSTLWEDKLKSLFTTLTKIAYPDGSAPVLSDDTDTPWAEKNDISGTLTLGYLLFDDPAMGHFAKQAVQPKYLWYLSRNQLEGLKSIKATPPETKSYAFTDTGYSIMREGWKASDKMLIISAGLDKDKPDHQHGDMLGIQAMANEHVVLPNYQVRYSLDDLELFKNSEVKNVALTDNILQGKHYTSNKGGSGFGKFKSLPEPKVLGWLSNESIDLFIGSHDGFEEKGVTYTRQVISVEDDFWIVKDNFYAKEAHIYKQQWQGHYTTENGAELLRSNFSNGSGLDIYQLNKVDRVTTSGKRGKQWSTVSKEGEASHSFITVLYPYSTYDTRILETDKNPSLKGWSLHNGSIKILSKGNTSIYLNISKAVVDTVNIEIPEGGDIMTQVNNQELTITLLSGKKVAVIVTQDGIDTNYTLQPATEVTYKIK